MRPILSSISLSALSHNLAIAQSSAPHSKVMAVIKANAYGHGLLNAAKAFKAADGFAILGLDEALTLRAAGYQQTILMLEGFFSADELPAIAEHAISIVVHSEKQVEILESAILSRPVNIHLKINTGMNRLGFKLQAFKPQAFDALLARLQACKNVSEISLMTHFATADEALGIETPLALFTQTTQTIHGLQAHEIKRSLANSAALLRFPEAHANWVRAGIMLYGSSPMAEQAATRFNLIPVMQFTSEIIAVQTLEAGENLGYGHRFTATQTTRIGVVACGYADGYPRHAPNGTPIAVAGKLTQILGRVSMDMLFVDITDIKEAEIGTAVEMWGKQVSVDAVAQAAGTISYELLCAIAPRVPLKVVA
jgi:alanine racemase